MKITSIERIDLDIPYFERVREHLQKGWGLANRATDDEYAADKEKFQQQWRDSSPPSVTTSIYHVHTDYGSPDPVVALHSGVYDYFVMGGPVAGLTRNAHVAAVGDKPFWVQMALAADIATAFIIHLTAAIPNATLSHISLHMLLERSLLKDPFVVREGFTEVPKKAGLGVESDMDVVEQYRVG